MKTAENSFLALIVERDKEAQAHLCTKFAAAGCRLFIVEMHEQAIAWAGVLPFSAIIFNAAADDFDEGTMRNFQYMREKSHLAGVSWWAIGETVSLTPLNDWRHGGLTELLPTPLQPGSLRDACAALASSDPHFYQRYDGQLREGFSLPIIAALPEMDAMLARQVAAFVPVLMQLSEGAIPPGVCREAHAIKSAALNLGYFNLAALMNEIEHVNNAGFLATHGNWEIIACVLDGRT